MERTSGILLHISSLPSPYGIGTLGREAFRFVDFLKRAGQSCWQILPIGPTSVGDSPYQSCSVYAGNPYFIDLELLREKGLLEPRDFEDADWGEPGRVDYGALYRFRAPLLERAFRRGRQLYAAQFADFRAKNPWLEDYGLFLSLKRKYGMLPWTQWPKPAARRDPAAIARYREELREDVSYYAFVQYLFYEQWNALHAYAAEQGIRIIGDLPIYVTMDSVDVWLYPELFQLDETLAPTAVAGCPPDGFNADGQLWGNPLYDWARMEKTRFAWWKERVRAAARCFDVIRIVYKRQLESYWAVPYGDETAINGRWVKGPGMKLVRAIRRACPETAFIAEDLGFLTDDVIRLREQSGLPGMKVLEFAFFGGDNDYLPHNAVQNAVCYTGTHDNQTLAQWYDELEQDARAFTDAYLGLNETEGPLRGILRGGMSTVCRLFVAQLQDWLGIGAEGRMNTPGELTNKNWSWRLTELPGPELADEIYEMTERYARLGRQVRETTQEEPCTTN